MDVFNNALCNRVTTCTQVIAGCQSAALENNHLQTHKVLINYAQYGINDGQSAHKILQCLT